MQSEISAFKQVKLSHGEIIKNIIYFSLMKKIVAFYLSIIFSLLGPNVYSQSEFDRKVSEITQQLVKRIEPTNKKRIAVISFMDLQGNVTELGKYIAEAFSVELVNTRMEVVDRSRIKDLLAELKMSEEKLVNPSNALKLGELAGLEFVVTGTTTMLDNSIDISIKAMDLQRGVIAAAQRGSIPRTDAINQLFRSQVNGTGVPSATATMPQALGNNNVDATDDVNQVKSTAMKKSICKDSQGNFQASICFENQMKTDLILGGIGPLTYVPNTLIAAGGKGCTPLLWINGPYATEPLSKEYYFHFKTTDKEKPLYGSFTIVAEGCVTKSVMLHPRNFLLSDKRLF